MTADPSTTLRYGSPAAHWTEALPIGNGRLGAMCFGGVGLDRFQLNEATCWSGSPSAARGTAEDGPAILASARAASLAGDVRAAEEWLRRLQGGHSQAYQPLADLWIEQATPEQPDGYRRQLELRTAVASHAYRTAAGRVRQEAWLSAPAQALVIRRRVEPANETPIRIRLDSPHPTAVLSAAAGGLDLVVRMPSDVAPAHAAHADPVRYDRAAVTAVVGLRVVTAGLMTVADSRLRLDYAGDVLIVVGAVTDYADPFTDPHGDVAALRRALDDRLAALAVTLAGGGSGYTDLRTAHELDHARLFGRVELRLGTPARAAVRDTGERVRARDPALAALQFQYGRYLLIACSRPGGLPANLQGLWNDQIQPPWSSNYTTNINLEMNYWPAEVANLSECHRPLLDWLSHARRRGAEVARQLYGLSGWTLHHNSDAWCFGLPAGDGDDDVCWSFWPLAGAWLCRHLGDHYDYTRDRRFLTEQAWPTVRAAAEFCLDWLVELPDGTLGTAPSTSPENHYVAADGLPAAAGVATTADLVLIRDLLTRLVGLAADLPRPTTPDTEVVTRARAALARIPAERIGPDGRLAEWSADLADAEPGHRHTSHLVGVFPAHTVDPETTPELAAAARRALDARGPESTGWSLAWRIALRARLRDAEGAHAMVRRFLAPAGDERAGIYRNLFCAHPPFQIDGNFGFTAGVAEMLLQSQASTDAVTDLHLLPALPAAWREGAFAGLRARGGVTVDAGWAHRTLRVAVLRSDTDRQVTVRAGARRAELTTRAGVPLRLDAKLRPVG